MAALQELGLSQRAACRITGCARSVAQYKMRRTDEPRLIERIRTIAMERRRFGYRRIGLMLRREGIVANHKRVHRIYRDLGLQLRPRRKRGVRYVRGNAVPPVTQPNERWSLDFVHDRLWTGRKFRCLTVVDDFTRECIAIEVDFSFPSRRVVTTFERIASRRPLPTTLKSDNGSEFPSEIVLKWSAEKSVDLHFHRTRQAKSEHHKREFQRQIAGRATQRARLSDRLHARSAIEAWRVDYNEKRPHTQLDGLTPAEFILQTLKTLNSRSELAS